MKKDLKKIFIDEIYETPPKKMYETNKLVYNQFDEIWSIDLADMIDYKISNNKAYRYILIIVNNFNKYLWAIPLKIEFSQTLTIEFSIILSTSKRRLLELESDRGSEFYNFVFPKFLKMKNIHHFSSVTDKGPSIAERVIRTVRNLLKKPVSVKGRADWLSELPSVIKQYNNSIHSSTKMTPNQASKKSVEKEVFSNLLDRRVIQKAKFNLG